MSQALLLQITSHAHAKRHSTPASQLFGPLHVTLHGPPPHVTPSSQAPLPPQTTVHAVALLQSTPLPHEFDPVQLTTHSIPSGHSTSAMQALLPPQSTRQVS